MDKKVLKAMYKNIAERADEIRPGLRGIHFEANRCYATDAKILVVYNQGSEKLSGKTISFDGQEIKGKYPDVDRVIPTDMPFAPLTIDLRQLYKAAKWHLSQPTSKKDDILVFGDYGLFVGNLAIMLGLFDIAGELGTATFTLNDPSRPCKVESESLTAILMPVAIKEEHIDFTIDGDKSVISYEMFIFNYADKNWRKKEAVEEMAWL